MLLKRFGVNPSLQLDQRGMTLLHYAALHGEVRIRTEQLYVHDGWSHPPHSRSAMNFLVGQTVPGANMRFWRKRPTAKQVERNPNAGQIHCMAQTGANQTNFSHSYCLCCRVCRLWKTCFPNCKSCKLPRSRGSTLSCATEPLISRYFFFLLCFSKLCAHLEEC